MKKIKFNLSFSKLTDFIFKHISLITVFISSFIIISIIIFLYFNFYLSITSAERVNVLKESLTSEKLNMKLLDEVQEKINKKRNLKEFNWDKIIKKETNKNSDKKTTESKKEKNKKVLQKESVDIPQPSLGL